MEHLTGESTQKAVAALLIVLAAFYSYFFAPLPKKWFAKIREKNGDRAAVLSRFIYLKVSGFIIMGVIPALLWGTLYGSGLLSREKVTIIPLNAWLLLTISVCLILIISPFSARRPAFYSRFPQIRLPIWSLPEVSTAVMGWAIYLLGYELLFRGVLLYAWVDAYGLATGITVNVALYSAFHLPNGRDEALGALFFGLMLCLLSLQTGTIIPAFILHLCLSVPSEMLAIHYNPNMRFNISKRRNG